MNSSIHVKLFSALTGKLGPKGEPATSSAAPAPPDAPVHEIVDPPVTVGAMEDLSTLSGTTKSPSGGHIHITLPSASKPSAAFAANVDALAAAQTQNELKLAGSMTPGPTQGFMAEMKAYFEKLFGAPRAVAESSAASASAVPPAPDSVTAHDETWLISPPGGPQTSAPIQSPACPPTQDSSSLIHKKIEPFESWEPYFKPDSLMHEKSSPWGYEPSMLHPILHTENFGIEHEFSSKYNELKIENYFKDPPPKKYDLNPLEASLKAFSVAAGTTGTNFAGLVAALMASKNLTGGGAGAMKPATDTTPPTPTATSLTPTPPSPEELKRETIRTGVTTELAKMGATAHFSLQPAGVLPLLEKLKLDPVEFFTARACWQGVRSKRRIILGQIIDQFPNLPPEKKNWQGAVEAFEAAGGKISKTDQYFIKYFFENRSALKAMFRASINLWQGDHIVAYRGRSCGINENDKQPLECYSLNPSISAGWAPYNNLKRHRIKLSEVWSTFTVMQNSNRGELELTVYSKGGKRAGKLIHQTRTEEQQKFDSNYKPGAFPASY